MATKEPTVSSKTPEQIAEMEREVREYYEQQAAAKLAEDREAAKPLIDLMTSDGVKAIRDAIPALDALVVGRFPDMRVHVDALRHGLTGLDMAVGPYLVEPAQAETAA